MQIFNNRYILFFFGITLTLSVISCKQGPNTGDTIPLKTEPSMADVHKDVIMDLRKITIAEAVPTSKYLYLKVTEDGREYWMATSQTAVNSGEVYYYNEALIRTDFESKEMQRVFDTIYLVTRIVPEAQVDKLKSQETKATPQADASTSDDPDSPAEVMQGNASPVQISEIFDNPEAFEGRKVEISGTCTKVNEGILSRNWIHVKDGSADDKDLVVTSSASVKPGDRVKLQAFVRLDKDFGAGYRYAIILEDGILVE